MSLDLNDFESLKDQLSAELQGIVKRFIKPSINSKETLVLFGTSFIISFKSYLDWIKSNERPPLGTTEKLYFEPLNEIISEIVSLDPNCLDDIMNLALLSIKLACKDVLDKATLNDGIDQIVNALLKNIQSKRKLLKVKEDAVEMGVPVEEFGSISDLSGMEGLVSKLRRLGEYESRRSEGYSRHMVSMPAIRIINTHPSIQDVFMLEDFSTFLAKILDAFTVPSMSSYIWHIDSFYSFLEQAEMFEYDLRTYLNNPYPSDIQQVHKNTRKFSDLVRVFSQYREQFTALKSLPRELDAIHDYIIHVALSTLADRSEQIVNGDPLITGGWYRTYQTRRMLRSEQDKRLTQDNENRLLIQTREFIVTQARPQVRDRFLKDLDAQLKILIDAYKQHPEQIEEALRKGVFNYHSGSANFLRGLYEFLKSNTYGFPEMPDLRESLFKYIMWRVQFLKKQIEG